jgi:hypothetical protein
MLDDGRIVQVAVDVAKKKINEARAIELLASLFEEFKTK